MIKNKIVRRLALLASLIILLTSTANATFCLIITRTDSLINTFTPFDSIISNLLISKNVEHPFGEEYVIPEDIAFDFKVDFGSLYAKTTIKTTTGDIVTDENGSIQISVKPGNSFAVEGIDAGTKVTVTEMQKDGSGFTVKDGAATMEGVVAEDGSLKFQYVNVYTPASISPLNVFVSGSKILKGRDWQVGDSFSFVLEQKKSDDTWMSLDTKTVLYNDENETFNYFDFTDAIQALTFDRVGVYDFRITEVVGNLENIDYDKSINNFSIHVTDVDMDGKLEINTVTAGQNANVNEIDGKYNVGVTFSNTYIPIIPDPENITVEIDVKKTINKTGDLTISPEGFEFVLENIDSKEKLALKTDKNGNGKFSILFTAADIGKEYTYKLSETDDGMPGVTYDNRVYDISIVIALSEDNKLIANTLMNGEAIEKPIAEFMNSYHSEIIVSPQTGDNSNVTFWFIMMILSGSACIFLIIIENKHRQRERLGQK